MNGGDPFTGWIVTGLGVVMFLQALPVLRAADKEERKRHLLNFLKQKRD